MLPGAGQLVAVLERHADQVARPPRYETASDNRAGTAGDARTFVNRMDEGAGF